MLALIEYGASWKRRCSIPLMSIMKSVVNVMKYPKSILWRFQDFKLLMCQILDQLRAQNRKGPVFTFHEIDCSVFALFLNGIQVTSLNHRSI